MTTFNDVEEVPIEIPDWDETQQIDDPEDQREVSLFLEVQNGKVKGAETTPFVLPHRWTYVTLRHCVKDFVFRNYGARVQRLFYKRAKGKAVVCLDSKGDIPALMKEYPLTYPSGKKKSGKSTVMYLAVQLEGKDKALSTNTTPKRSPRTQYIFVHKYNCEDQKVTTTAQLLHNVDNDAILSRIIELLHEMNEDNSAFMPKKGMFWLRKGTKQPVTLRNDKDLETCRKEYGNVATKYVGNSNASHQRKRRLDMSQGGGSGGSKGDNQLWNEVHINVVRYNCLSQFFLASCVSIMGCRDHMALSMMSLDEITNKIKSCI